MGTFLNLYTFRGLLVFVNKDVSVYGSNNFIMCDVSHFWVLAPTPPINVDTLKQIVLFFYVEKSFELSDFWPPERHDITCK